MAIVFQIKNDRNENRNISSYYLDDIDSSTGFLEFDFQCIPEHDAPIPSYWVDEVEIEIDGFNFGGG